MLIFNLTKSTKGVHNWNDSRAFSTKYSKSYTNCYSPNSTNFNSPKLVELLKLKDNRVLVKTIITKNYAITENCASRAK
jgi:hypothetical protein